jgi:1-deoxy-D-xylulose-5-phosphate synthase
LQRAYDQIIHDICLQNLHVVFCLDRAGLVGADGPTHHGTFDIAYLRHIPNMTLMAPKNTAELKAMLNFAVSGCDGPVALRYPKGSDTGETGALGVSDISRGKGEVIKEGKDAVIFALGSMVKTGLEVCRTAAESGMDVALVNARFVKPIDEELIVKYAGRVKKIITLEEGVEKGGFGSAVSEVMQKYGLNRACLKIFGIPDNFIEHGKKDALLEKCGLSSEKVLNFLKDSQTHKSLCQG